MAAHVASRANLLRRIRKINDSESFGAKAFDVSFFVFQSPLWPVTFASTPELQMKLLTPTDKGWLQPNICVLQSDIPYSFSAGRSYHGLSPFYPAAETSERR